MKTRYQGNHCDCDECIDLRWETRMDAVLEFEELIGYGAEYLDAED